MDDSDGIEEGALEIGLPTSVGSEGLSIVDPTEGKEEVLWEEGGAIEEHLIGSAKGAGIGDYHYVPLWSPWVYWGGRIGRCVGSHFDTIFSA